MREPTPTVSVGIPAYNAARWVGEAIESILGQSLTGFELIISDNGSTDSTYDLCSEYQRRDSRIRLHRNTDNVGANRNYMLVLARARGRYFKWASSNDICGPTFLEDCVAHLERDPSAVLAYPRTSLFALDPADAQPYDGDFELKSGVAMERLSELLDVIGLNNAFNGVMRREQLMRARPMGVFQRADIALMAELALMGRFLLVDKRLFFRRMSAESATRLQTAQQVDRHLVPAARRPLRMQNWRFYLAVLSAVLRQNPTPAAVAYVGRRMRWARAALFSDVRDALLRKGW